MLYEIVCDKFKTKKVLFNSGLNTVLGTNEGDNSIGKSSFLLIVDFVFGGTTYAKSEDIIKILGNIVSNLHLNLVIRCTIFVDLLII